MFDKKGFTEFRKEVEVALENLAKKYNVNIKTGKIKHAFTDFVCTIIIISQ